MQYFINYSFYSINQLDTEVLCKYDRNKIRNTLKIIINPFNYHRDIPYINIVINKIRSKKKNINENNLFLSRLDKFKLKSIKLIYIINVLCNQNKLSNYKLNLHLISYMFHNKIIPKIIGYMFTV